MTGDRLARLSLRFDAIYCITLGFVVAVTSPFTAKGVALPSPFLIGVGVATLLWGTYVWRTSYHRPIQTSTRLVMVANIAASLGLAATGLLAGTTVLTLAAIALAVDVAAFAVSQGIALQRLKGSNGAIGRQ